MSPKINSGGRYLISLCHTADFICVLYQSEKESKYFIKEKETCLFSEVKNMFLFFFVFF